MCNFKADFYMVREVVEGVDFDDVCEHVWFDEVGHEDFKGKLVFKKKQGTKEMQVTFHFSPIFDGYDEEGQPAGDQRGWKYRGCVYEEFN